MLFLRDLGERAAKTFLQTYFAAFLVGDVALNVFEFSWGGPQFGIALGATVLSVVTSLLSKPFGSGDSASIVPPAPGGGAHELQE